MCFPDLKVFLVLILCSAVCAINREFECHVVQDESGSTKEVEVVHIAAKGPNDTIHYLWSTFKLPSVITARASIDSELTINATKLKAFDKDAITFSEGPFEAIGISISKIWELNYINDSNLVTQPNFTTPVDLDLFEWMNMSSSLDCGKHFASAYSKADYGDDIFSEHGAIKIQFNASGQEEASTEFPHLIFNGKSTLLKVDLDHLHTDQSKTRFGLEIRFFSVPCSNCTWQQSTIFSVNDENSPGVFSDISLSSSCPGSKTNSFVAWRPVAYVGEVKNIANSSDALMVGQHEINATMTPHSIAELYFEGKSKTSAFNIYFGTVGDGYYGKAKFISWSFMVGAGSAVEVKSSTVVFIVMAVGLGALLLFFVGGGAFLGCKFWCKKDDDLLLSEDSIN
ncbi:glycosylated lysosomal membrane protein-like [Uloborus diversus]|uniref:glycosylated lysosomal membrane protein-like n=1 Tax=Uloborus diversus TaxID=327109 RepID=UPI00240A1220|nr:glycosylated lysosomal membrane protein-like [Uloborus diversus]